MNSKSPFGKKKKCEHFIWDNLDNIKEARKELCEEMPVFIYRLMQYTMMDVLRKAHGIEMANKHFRAAGHLAGTEFAQNGLFLSADFNTFISNLKRILRDLKIGILRMEDYDPDSGKIILTIAQDLDFSGAHINSKKVCVYDEGVIAGILETYTGKKYEVRKEDCQTSGERICRFVGAVIA